MPNVGPTTTIDLQTSPPADGFYASGVGAVFQNCPLTGCVAGNHEQSALYLKATAHYDKSIAEYMAVFDCNLNSGSTGIAVGISDNKVCVFNNATTGSSAGNATWVQANDLALGAGDTGLFKVNTEIDLTNSAADCAIGVKNCYHLFLSGIVANPVTSFINITAPVGTVTTAAHYGIIINGAKMDAADIENSGTAPVGICVGCLSPGAHSSAAFKDNSTAPNGLWLNGTYANFSIQAPGFNVGPTGRAAYTSATITGSTPTVAAGQIGIGSTIVAAGSGTCPTGVVGGATVQGCITVNIAGTPRNVPFF
jgi:hypothetical protein